MVYRPNTYRGTDDIQGGEKWYRSQKVPKLLGKNGIWAKTYRSTDGI